MARIHLLGATSWIGYRLAECLKAAGGEWQVSGTSRSGRGPTGLRATLSAATSPTDHISVLSAIVPAVVVNLLRGEDENGMSVHRAMVDWCARHDAFYCYASSVLALDGYRGEPLTEDLPARSSTPYGRFKQSCEAAMLERSDCRHLILRFPSIQGWVPHKPTRNESFLRRLAAGERVTVDRGVLQNRLLDSTFAKMVVDLLNKAVTGIVHLGTDDSSEEYDFLRRVAAAFGFTPNLIISGARRDANLVAIPCRIHEIFGGRYRTSESDTVNGLLTYGGLLRYSAGIRRAAVENQHRRLMPEDRNDMVAD